MLNSHSYIAVTIFYTIYIFWFFKEVKDMEKTKKIAFGLGVIVVLLAMAVTMFTMAPQSARAADEDYDVWSGDIALSFASGEGTEGSPYIISTGEELALLAQLVNRGSSAYISAHYKLDNDIYLNDLSLYNVWSEGLVPENSWTPIGSRYNNFKGIFDGDGNAIYGMYFNTTDDYQGLFGYINGSNVKNVGVEKSRITGGEYVGAVAGYADKGSTVSGCYNRGTVLSNDTNVGGVLGRLYYSIAEKCFNEGYVLGRDSVGGVFGEVTASTVSKCYNVGLVESNYQYSFLGGVAGIIAYHYDYATTLATLSYIFDSYNTGNVIGAGTVVGGITGELNGADATNCYNTGTVSGTDKIGGISGDSYLTSSTNVKITNCYNTGLVTGSAADALVGGILGRKAYSSMKISYSYYLTGTASAVIGGTSNTTTYSGEFDSAGALAAGVTTGSPITGTSTTLADALNAWVTYENTTNSGSYTAWTGTTYPALTGIGTSATAVVWDGSIAAAFAAGSGDGSTEANAILIENGAQLAYLSQQVKAGNAYADKYIKLAADIKLNNTTGWDSWSSTTTGLNAWTPIGTYEAGTAYPFSGNFDGNGYEISGIFISSNTNFQGLFGYIDGGSVSDIKVSESYIKGSSISGTKDDDALFSGNTGGIAGYITNSSQISDCVYSGNVEVGAGGSTLNTGGIVGNAMSSKIANCYFTGKATAASDYNLGGIAGRIYASELIYCYSTGAVTGRGYVGGILGLLDKNSTVSNSYNVGLVVTTYNTAGGIVGQIVSSSNSLITNCYNTGMVTGTNEIGGIVGYMYSGKVDNCYNAGAVTGTGVSVGGIAGEADTISNSFFLDGTASTGFGTGSNDDVQTGAYMFGTDRAYYSYDASASAWTASAGKDYIYALNKQVEALNEATGNTTVYLYLIKGGDIPAIFTTEVINLGYSVTFISDGQTVSTVDTDGSAVSAPAGVTKAYYTLVGWYTEANVKWDFNATIAEDITLYAKWSLENIAFGGDSVVNAGGTYKPAGYSLGQTITHSLTVSYQWSYATTQSGTYTDITEADGGKSSSMTVINVADSGFYKLTATVTDGSETKTAFVIYNVAITKATYDMSGIGFTDKTVGYDGNAHTVEITGSLPAGVTVNYTGGDKKQGGRYTVTATFTGDADNYNAIAPMSAVLTINVTINSNSPGVSDDLFDDYVPGEPLPTPERDGYDFDGWYTDESLSEESKVDSIDENTDLYADWSLSKPSITTDNTAKETDGGTQLSVAVDEIDGMTYTYQWQKQDDSGNWADVSGATGKTLELTESGDNGTYRLKITVSDGTLESQIFSASQTVDLKSGGLPVGAIVGITVGGVLLLLILIYVLGYFLLYKRSILLEGAVWNTVYVPMNALFGKKENEASEPLEDDDEDAATKDK